MRVQGLDFLINIFLILYEGWPLLKIDFFSLPNLISGKEILPELLQSEVNIEKIISSVNLIQKNGFNFYKDEFIKIRENLRGGGAEKASQEILKLLNW